jgi:hypothetical protein
MLAYRMLVISQRTVPSSFFFSESIIEAAIQSIRIGLRISGIAFHVSKTI